MKGHFRQMKFFEFVRPLFRLLLASLTLTACMQAPKFDYENATVDSIAKRIEIKRDDFEKTTMMTAPSFSSDDFEEVYMLAIKQDKGELIGYFVMISERRYSDWAHYEEGKDEHGESLDVRSIHKDVDCSGSGCSYSEKALVGMTEDYLEKYKDTGVKIKLYGRSGSGIFDLPAKYIAAMLYFAKSQGQ